MPNITKTGIRANTRTMRTLDKQNKPEEEKKQTPNKLVEEKRKNYKPNKFNERKYFNVEEDHTIQKLYVLKKDSLSTRDIADQLAGKMTHTAESIRDRIKRYISKLSVLDIDLLKEEAKVSIIQFLLFMLYVYKLFD